MSDCRIHVSLLGEGVDVWRPVIAEHERGSIYRICDQPYDREAETWEFSPGASVVCEERLMEDDSVLVAVGLSDERQNRE